MCIKKAHIHKYLKLSFYNLNNGLKIRKHKVH